jgi:hypothetical protein
MQQVIKNPGFIIKQNRIFIRKLSKTLHINEKMITDYLKLFVLKEVKFRSEALLSLCPDLPI